MIAKEIQCSITKTYLNKLRICRGVHEWADTGVLIINYGPTMISFLFKSINSATRIGFSNLKYYIEKATLTKFGKNAKDLLHDMSSNSSIIFDKVESHEYYVHHIFRALLLGPNSSFNSFINIAKDDWDTVTELSSGEHNHNDTKKYNGTASEKERTKKYPKAAEILVLKTCLSKLEEK